MERRRYSYIDLYYNKSDRAAALKERKRLESLGYELQVEDDGGEKYEYCDQFLKYHYIKTIAE